jgi:hypothetical protein
MFSDKYSESANEFRKNVLQRCFLTESVWERYGQWLYYNSEALCWDKHGLNIGRVTDHLVPE